MGLRYAFRELLNGQPANAFNGLFSSDDLLAAQNQAGDALSSTISRQQAEGLIDANQAGALYQQIAPNTDSDAYWSQSGDTPLQVFNQALEDQASAIGRFGSSAINRTLGLGFRLIPWQVYVIGFVLLLVWLYPIWRPFASALAKRK
jgi:hypothetical protein